MLNYLLEKIDSAARLHIEKIIIGAFCVITAGFGVGCKTESTPLPPAQVMEAQQEHRATTNDMRSMILQEGDTLKISFPDAATLDSVQSIRRDGKITLSNIGEIPAAGKTPGELEADIRKAYGNQLVNTNISVTVQSSAFVVYVFGTVAKPGKIISDRPLSPLEALIEAGVDDTKGNLKKVQIIRTDTNGQTHKFKLDLYHPLHNENEPLPTFKLMPFDYIYVPERFNLL